MQEPFLPSTDPTSQLRAYILAKQRVVDHVRAAREFIQARGTREGIELCQALLVKLAEDRFNLAVVGQFKRGKSSLMNAVLGRDVLPTGLLPLTSAITTLCYGPQSRAVLRRKGWTLTQEITLDQLADYVTERGNPGNEKGLIEAQVELPERFLRRGLHFIDTPGIGSARHENTATTYEFLPEADAVIFVTSVEAPLSAPEEDFLREIRTQVRQLFIVVNKLDLIAAEESAEVLAYIRAHLEQTLGTPDLRLYPVSAREGLAAKMRHDNVSLTQSGLARFEEDLTTFLAEEQGRAFLVAILDRVLHLLADVRLLATESSASSAGARESERDHLRQRVEEVRAQLLVGTSLAAIVAPCQPEPTDTEILEEAIAGARGSPRSGAGRANLRSGTCPICAAQTQTLFDFFAHWQYDLASEPAAQRAFVATHGFCPAHTWQFQDMASPRGMSAGYAPVVDATVVELQRALNEPPEHASAQIGTLLPDVATCPACKVLQAAEADHIAQLLAQLATVEAQDTYARSAGVCLHHLQATLATKPDNAIAVLLIQEQIRHLEEIAEDMRSFTLKRDAIRRGLVNDQEEHAWRRALVQLVGERRAHRLDAR